jgi:hypothetical protein
MTIRLPIAITECDEYRDLSQEDRDSFLRRLESARELGLSLAHGDRRRRYPDFFQFVEDLELDVSHLQEFDSRNTVSLSRWATHYSWTFYTSPGEMRSLLAEEVLQLINAIEPSTDVSLDTSERWFGELGRGLAISADAIINASDYGSAMAHQIALDILLTKLLTTCYKLRFNRLVPR